MLRDGCCTEEGLEIIVVSVFDIVCCFALLCLLVGGWVSEICEPDQKRCSERRYHDVSLCSVGQMTSRHAGKTRKQAREISEQQVQIFLKPVCRKGRSSFSVLSGRRTDEKRDGDNSSVRHTGRQKFVTHSKFRPSLRCAVAELSVEKYAAMRAVPGSAAGRYADHLSRVRIAPATIVFSPDQQQKRTENHPAMKQ